MTSSQKAESALFRPLNLLRFDSKLVLPGGADAADRPDDVLQHQLPVTVVHPKHSRTPTPAARPLVSATTTSTRRRQAKHAKSDLDACLPQSFHQVAATFSGNAQSSPQQPNGSTGQAEELSRSSAPNYARCSILMSPAALKSLSDQALVMANNNNNNNIDLFRNEEREEGAVTTFSASAPSSSSSLVVANDADLFSKYAVRLETTQLSKFRSAFDAIKDIIHDINLKFFPPGHPDHGMRMMAMDNAHVALVDMVCPAREICEAGSFYCKRPVLAGISVAKFYKIIKTFKNNDSLALYIEDNNEGVLEICTYNPKLNTRPRIKVTLLDLNDSDFALPAETFDTVRYIKAEKFQTTVHNLIQAVDPDSIGIHYKDGELKITGEGDYAKIEISLSEIEVNPQDYSASGGAQKSAADLVVKKQVEIHNYYPVRYISTAIKPYQVCEDLCLYVKHDWPLVVEYPLAGLGTLRFCIAPKDNPDEQAMSPPLLGPGLPKSNSGGSLPRIEPAPPVRSSSQCFPQTPPMLQIASSLFNNPGEFEMEPEYEEDFAP